MELGNISSEIKDIAINTITESVNSAISEGDLSDSVMTNSIEKASSVMEEMGAPKEVIDLFSSNLAQVYNNSLENGSTVEEALNLVISKLGEFSESENKDDFKGDEISENINLDFLHSSDSPRLELMDQAIAKGMSVEDALKYVNDKMFSQNESFQGPSLTEIRDIKNNEYDTAKIKIDQSEESNQLNKIEADMDAEASNLTKEISEETLNSNKENYENTNIPDELKDDEVS